MFALDLATSSDFELHQTLQLDFKGSAAGKPVRLFGPEGKLTKEGRPRWIKKGPEAEAAIN